MSAHRREEDSSCWSCCCCCGGSQAQPQDEPEHEPLLPDLPVTDQASVRSYGSRQGLDQASLRGLETSQGADQSRRLETSQRVDQSSLKGYEGGLETSGRSSLMASTRSEGRSADGGIVTWSEVSQEEDADYFHSIILDVYVEVYIMPVSIEIEHNLEQEYGLVDCLRQEGMLEEEDLDDISGSVLQRAERNRKLLKKLRESNVKNFCVGLKMTNQIHLASYINIRGLAQGECNDSVLDEPRRHSIDKIHQLLTRDISKETVTELLGKACISGYHHKSIVAHKNRYDMNTELLEIIKRRSLQHYNLFLDVLDKHHTCLKKYLTEFTDGVEDKVLVEVVTQNSLSSDVTQNIIDRFYSRKADDKFFGDACFQVLDMGFLGGRLYLVIKSENNTDIDEAIHAAETLRLLGGGLSKLGGGVEVRVQSLKSMEMEDETDGQSSNRTSDGQSSNMQIVGSVGSIGSVDKFPDEPPSPSTAQPKAFTTAPPKPARDPSAQQQQDTPVSPYLNPPNKPDIIEHKKKLTGVTTLDDKIFVIRDKQPCVYIYDSSSLAFTAKIPVPGMKKPQSLVSCAQRKCLYITDSERLCVYRVNLPSNAISSIDLNENGYEPRGLSVTPLHTLLVTVRIGGGKGESRVLEYNNEGEKIREIWLHDSVKYASHTVMINQDQFILSHGFEASQHRVCVVNNGGQVIRGYGGKKGAGEGQLSDPRALALSRISGQILVADTLNNRVIILGSELNYIGLVNISRKVKHPFRIHLDSATGRLFLGQEGNGNLIIITP